MFQGRAESKRKLTPMRKKLLPLDRNRVKVGAEKFRKSLGKPLDIKHKMCYNVYVKRKDTSQTRKATTMKKSLLQSLVNYLNGETVTNLDEIKTELEAELGKGQAKANANRALYAEMGEAVMETLRTANAPVTAQEIADATGFARGKIVWGLTHEWADAVVKTEGKVNTYSLA